MGVVVENDLRELTRQEQIVTMQTKSQSMPRQGLASPRPDRTPSLSRQIRHPLGSIPTSNHPETFLFRSQSIQQPPPNCHIRTEPSSCLPSQHKEVSLPLIHVKRPALLHPLAKYTHTKFNTRVKSFTRETLNLERRRHFTYGAGSEEGGRVNNQDRVVIERISIGGQYYDYLAIFDGHAGSHTAQYLSQHLHTHLTKLLQKHPPQQALQLALRQADLKLAQHLKMKNKSGSCALILLVTPQTIWVANVGDSRLIAVDHQGKVNQITTDHKPEAQGERTRIEQAGGRVYRNKPEEPFRLYPGGLSVSRTIGDLELKKLQEGVLISDPTVFSLPTNGVVRLAMMSDGVYERLSNQEIMQLLGDSPSEGVSRVMYEAAARRSMDNRSMIAFSLH